ncbi:MAG: hypothetical protein K0Q92_343 [Steroidobacteraceae bacterium]|nr:hypothetical protein [Steroidobacteraceae bacterium]
MATTGATLADVSTTAWTNENRASRVPFTGNTIVSGDTFTSKRRCNHSAMAWRVSGRPAVTG